MGFVLSAERRSSYYNQLKSTGLEISNKTSLINDRYVQVVEESFLLEQVY